MKICRQFFNELKNHIRLEIRTCNNPLNFQEVHIYMNGPLSDTNWTLTKLEAEKLHKDLGKILKSVDSN